MIRGFDESKIFERYSNSKFSHYHSFAELSNIPNRQNLKKISKRSVLGLRMIMQKY